MHRHVAGLEHGADLHGEGLAALTASWLNIVAASAISIGGLIPFVSFLVAGREGHEVSPVRVGATVAAFFLVGLVLHLLAHTTLPRSPKR